MLALRKLWRELAAQKGQTLAVVGVVALGVMLFITSAGAYDDLRASYSHTQATLAQADVQVDVTTATSSDLTRVRGIDGVATADGRVVSSVPVRIGGTRLALRVLSLPPAGQPLLDRVLVLSGRLPEDGEVLVEKHLAEHHHLVAGSTIRAEMGGEPRELRVSGVGVSAEYLWVARDANDIFPSPDEFGVAWMRDTTGSFNQLLVDVAPAADTTKVLAAMEHGLGERWIGATKRDRLVGIRLLQMDVDGYRGMATFFPIFFLGIAAFIVAALLARLVDAQRSVLGTLMALGVGRAPILLQVLLHGVALGFVGSALGAALGLVSSPALTRAYAADLGIPFVTARFHGVLALVGTGCGLVVAVCAGLFPALHASSLAPAEAMRPARPRTGPLARLARRLPVPLIVRRPLRDLLGRPLRSTSTVLGVSAALVLVLVTGALLDSMRTTLWVIFHEARRYDLRADLVMPEPSSEARARFAHVKGVAQVEPILSVPATLELGGRSARVLAQGLPDGAVLVRSVDVDGRLVAPGPSDIVITRAVARELGVVVGASILVRVMDRTAMFRVGGLADGSMGPTASVKLEDLQRVLQVGDRVNAVAVSVPAADVPAARAAIAAMPDVVRLEDVGTMRAQVETLMGLGWIMLGAMLLFGAILAAAILFNTATLGILERRRELATLRALGRTQREISVGITVENALLAGAGLLLGYPLATRTAHAVLDLYSSDLFRLPYIMRSQTVALTVSGIFVVLLLAQWPALRRVARTSLAEAVRTRE